MNFSIQTIIDTPVAELWPLTEDDFEELYFVASDPAIWEQHFGQFVQAGHAVVLGEFGGKFASSVKPQILRIVVVILGIGVSIAFFVQQK